MYRVLPRLKDAAPVRVVRHRALRKDGAPDRAQIERLGVRNASPHGANAVVVDAPHRRDVPAKVLGDYLEPFEMRTSLPLVRSVALRVAEFPAVSCAGDERNHARVVKLLYLIQCGTLGLGIDAVLVEMNAQALHPASLQTSSASSPRSDSSLPSNTLFKRANPPSALH